MLLFSSPYDGVGSDGVGVGFGVGLGFGVELGLELGLVLARGVLLGLAVEDVGEPVGRAEVVTGA